MNKKITSMLAVLLILSVLFGCARATTNTIETTAPSTSKVVSEISGKTETTTATTTTAKQTATTKPSENTSKKSIPETTKKPTKITTKGHVTATKATTKKADVTSTTKNADKTHCTFTINCKAVSSHMDDLKDGKKDYVPSSGYIIKNCSVKYEDGDTVYDVLKRVCSENGIPLRAKMTGYGMYVEGLNNLFEKDCGGTSGWTYYVDGKFPPVAVDKYELHGGETIEFKYVV